MPTYNSKKEIEHIASLNTTMACMLHSSSQPSQFESQPLSQHAISEASQQSFGRGAHLGAMAGMARRRGSQDSLEPAASGGSGDERCNASERQEMPDHDNEQDAFSPVVLELHLATFLRLFLLLPLLAPPHTIPCTHNLHHIQ